MFERPDTHPTLSRFIGQPADKPESSAASNRRQDEPRVVGPELDAEGNRSARSPVGATPTPSQPQRDTTQPLGGDWVPKVELPKGGGAIRGIGEKIEANAFIGSASMTVPVAVPPARGLSPQLGLGYASGAGNGPFGVGWRLEVPSIRRKTEQELPTYWDGIESDTFVLAGAEDLVPLRDGSGNRVVDPRDNHDVYPYRPRVEGAFARIERWVHRSDGVTHWRVIGQDNVTSWYGLTSQARVADPDEASHVFEWKLEETRDDRGNIVQFTYKPEDATLTGTGIVAENNRADSAGSYLARIDYGNRAPDVADDWMFQVIFDYGEYGSIDGPTGETVVTTSEDQDWALRPDAFSWFKAGFDIRVRRRCQRILVFHQFDELDTAPVLVRSTDFSYEAGALLSRLSSVVARAYEPGTVTNGYVAADMPSLDLTYTSDVLAPVVRELDRRSMDNLPDGVDGRGFRFVDLEGEGLPGIVAEIEGTLHYKRPRGDGRFGALERLSHQVTSAKLGDGAELRDVDGDGRLELTNADGYYTRRAVGDWSEFVAFSQVPSIDLDDPNLQRIDLDGDGRVDLFIARDDGFFWYRSLGKEGWAPGEFVPKPSDERDGPAVLFADGTRTIFLADMSGDGLSDIVRVGNGSVYYWPNLGHGRFGRRVTMDGAPQFTAPDLFDPTYVRLADLDGSGTADLVYLDGHGARAWRNASGNGFSTTIALRGFPGVDSVTAAEVIDFFGKGTACLMWSTAADWAQPTKVLALDLLPEKPHLLVSAINNLGMETRLSWEPSTAQYLRDLEAGRPWITRLSFPVQVVTRVEHLDAVARRRFVQQYAYHHGYYDGIERELRGFAMVEQWDTESFTDFNHEGLFELDLYDTIEDNLHQAPVLTRTWFHTGAYLGRDRISRLVANEYWTGDDDAVDWRLPDTVLPSGLTAREAAEACRALRGRTLRQEVYALDGSTEEPDPYAVSEQNFTVTRLQSRHEEEHGVFFAHSREAIAMQYERLSTPDYDPRISHTLVLAFDDYGNPTSTATVAYPARDSAVSEQDSGSIAVAEASFCEVDDVATAPDVYRASVPVEQRTYELHVAVSSATAPLSFATVEGAVSSATRIDPEDSPSAGEMRLLSAARSFYYTDDLTGVLSLGACGTRALPYESHSAAFSEGQRAAVFGTDVPGTLLSSDGGYVDDDDLWWVRSGRQVFDDTNFYLPVTGIDPYGNETTVEYDDHALFVTTLTDAIGNEISFEHDYRVLAPSQVTDPNGSRTAVAFDTRGVVVAMAQLGRAGQSEGDTLSAPTSTFSYDPFSWRDDAIPVSVQTSARETHADSGTRWLDRIAYFDGSGNTILEKVNAEAGLAAQRDGNGDLVIVDDEVVLVQTDPRWVGTGRTVFDNKGNPVKQYEPYFSSTDAFEDEVELREQGVTPILHYDPLGRLIRTDFPDGTLSRVEFTPWLQRTFDQNDTAGDSDWYAERLALSSGDPERVAAESTDPHHDTPTVTHLDPLGRPVRVIQDLGSSTTLETRSVLDIEGNVLEVTDARGNTAEERVYGMAGQAMQVESVDAGQRRMVAGALGDPLRLFDDPAFGRVHRFAFDALRRVTHHYLQPSSGSERLVLFNVYGEIATNPEDDCLRGRLLRQYDGAGLVVHASYDFDGNLVEQSRQLTVVHDAVPDWIALDALTTLAAMDSATSSLLDSETFTTEGTFDAFGRPVTRTTPDGSVTQYGYNDAGLLESVSAEVRGATPATDFVDNIDYDVHGRRALVQYANGTSTTYAYDPLSFRLRRVTTERDSDSAVMQDLQYVYDAIGNITRITDGAQQTLYFDNTVVTPDQTLEYDALYRLVEATGREHASQGQPTESELTPGAQPEASDPAALRTYTESYTYDEVGNLTLIEHVASGGNWSRGYHYATDGNRLLSTSLPGDTVGTPATYSATYTHDDHGNMTAMPHLSAIDWDHAQRMQHVDLGGGGDVWFQYDAAGNRVRKVQVNSAGTAANERIYLGGVEVYRQRDVVSGALDAVNNERETLHIADDGGRIVMVETLTIDGGTPVSSPANVARYQHGNHLGTVALELDDSAAIISYEEFHPYGSSAYRAVDSTIGVSAKRYRYSGQERDEETGLDLMGARYYAPWLGRWTAADPIRIAGGINLYEYAASNPVRLADPSGMAPPSSSATDDAQATASGGEARSTPEGAFVSNPDGTISEGIAPGGSSEQQTASEQQSRARDREAATLGFDGPAQAFVPPSPEQKQEAAREARTKETLRTIHAEAREAIAQGERDETTARAIGFGLGIAVAAGTGYLLGPVAALVVRGTGLSGTGAAVATGTGLGVVEGGVASAVTDKALTGQVKPGAVVEGAVGGGLFGGIFGLVGRYVQIKRGLRAGGTPEAVPLRASARKQRNIELQNDSADFLAREGLSIRHNNRTLPNGKQPDYKIDGKYFDHLNVSSSNVEQARKGIKAKVRAEQAERIVVRLDDSSLTIADVLAILGRKPLEGLKELILIKAGTWKRYSP